MAVIAVAGGTGGVGKTVVEQLRLHAPHHTVLVMGRKTATETAACPPECLEVNYTDLETLTAILQYRNIDTVISTINLETEAGSQAQLNLIAAADRSQTTRRFIPSEFHIYQKGPNSEPALEGWSANARAIEKTSLEYIRISIGFFSDYWGMPLIKSNLKPFNWLLDMQKGLAAVPGTGDERFSVTYSEDLARVIVHLVSTDDRWPERGFLSGSDISLNELIASAERVRGSNLDVVHDSVEKLEKGDATVLWHPADITAEEFKPLLASLSQMIIAGDCLLPDDERRLDRLFPEIRLTSAEEILAKGWEGR